MAARESCVWKSSSGFFKSQLEAPFLTEMWFITYVWASKLLDTFELTTRNLYSPLRSLK